MRDRLRQFWDTSALAAAVLSTNAKSAARTVLKLAAVGGVDICVSPDVLRELDAVIESRRPALRPMLARLLNEINAIVTPGPGAATVAACLDLTGYMPDARVLAAAVECGAEVLVTNDSTHFLGNPLIGPPDTNVRAMSPAESLEWLRDRLGSQRT